MTSTQGQRIQANCKIIWDSATDYEIDIETDDYETYMASVKRDFGTSFGPPLTATGLCRSSDHAWRELDRMLGLWAQQVQSGQPMTKAQRLEIFSGPNGRNRAILERFLGEMERRGIQRRMRKREGRGEISLSGASGKSGG